MGKRVISTEKRGHVWWMGLDRAHKRNAFDKQMLRELSEAYTALEEDAELRCGLLFAHGDHFTAGLDLAEVGPAVAAGEGLFPVDGVDPLGIYGRRRSKPVVIAVGGWCLTIGIELALASDIVVAASDTRFAQIEVKRGIMPFGGATMRFVSTAGWHNAMRYLLTGDEFDAERARQMGLVQEVVEPGQQLEVAGAIAERIAAQAPLAVVASRRSAQDALELGHDAAAMRLMHEARALMHSEDAAEGVQSFLERRAGRFVGR